MLVGVVGEFLEHVVLATRAGEVEVSRPVAGFVAHG